MDHSMIVGKTVVMTGKFSQMTRKEAQAAVKKLGAVIGKGVSKNTDLLIYGDAAGSKLTKAQRLGVETRNEDWLVALLAGEDPEAAAELDLSGALSDYMERVDAFAKTLEEDLRVESVYFKDPGVSTATLEKVARDWGLDEVPEAIANFYRQANGFFIAWYAIHEPGWKPEYKYKIPRDKMPTPYQLESIPFEPKGIAWILPIEASLRKSKGYMDFHYGNATGVTDVWGGSFTGEELERSIRLLEYGIQYYPVGFLTHDVFLSDLPVILGDDYGAAWSDSYFCSFEGYLEDLLAGCFQSSVRRRMTHGYARQEVEWLERLEPVDYQSLLPKTKAIEVEDTFEVSFEEIEEVEGRDFRARAFHGRYHWKQNEIARTLDLDYKGVDPLEVAAMISDATMNASDIDMAAAKQIAKVLRFKRKSKKAVHENFFGEYEKGASLVIEIKTLFPASKQDKYKVESDMRALVNELAEEHGWEVLSTKKISSTGRKNRVTRAEVFLAGEHGVEVGQTKRFRACPTGFVEQDGAFIWQG